MEEKQPDQVIIYCGMHGLYERAEHNGYTNDPRKAGIYERSKVQDLVGSPYSERKNELLPVPEDHETRIAERIASLTAERDALAAQNVELRGVLEEALPYVNGFPNSNAHTLAEITSALSIPLPDAVANVAAMREKAELLDAMQENRWGITHGLGQCFVQVRSGHGTISLSSGATVIEALRAARGGK